MAQIEIVTTADRHDLDDQARAALLDLVRIDRAADRGTYAETNLWMRHR